MTISQNLQKLTEEQQLQIIQDEISLARKNAESVIKLSDAVKRLLDNEDFKLVVSEHYFDIELKKVATTISMNSNEDLVRRDVVRLKGIHCFREFLNNILLERDTASAYIDKSDEDLIRLYLDNYDIEG